MATPLETAQPPASHGQSGKDLEALARLGAELLRRAEESQPALEAAWDKLMATWGIQGELIEIERLREIFQQESGGESGNNSFSRELIANREGRGT